MFEHQIRLQDQYKEKAEPHEAPAVSENADLLKERLKALNQSRVQLEHDLDEQRSIVLALERDMNCIKPEKISLSKLKEKYQT